MAFILKSVTVFAGRTVVSGLLIGCRRKASTLSVQAVNMSKKSQVISNVVKSPLDKRGYRGIILPNSMKVLLVSDPLTDKSAASLSVAVGSMNDPVELPGLAHFLEHMLFLGTKKFPEENDYSKFLSENGGSSNAYTAKDHTNYYFDVAPTALKAALDRFSQFFISPLFTETATEREVNAVHSEHEKNIPSDPWRCHQIEVGTGNPKHPYSRFATGNKDTLWNKPKENNIDVRSALLDFHHNHYSSNIMSLAVLGTESLDELQELVESLFSDVECREGLTAPKWTENPYGSNELQTVIEMVPIKDVRNLSVTFPIPDTTADYKTSAEGYLSHLIGHEGSGSLLSLLKGKNWVNQLSAGSHIPARGFGVFKIAVDLTQDGMKNTDTIIKHMFEYLEMLRTVGPQQWVWEEMRDVNAMMYRFKDKEQPQPYVAQISSNMHNYPLEDVLSAGYILTEYKPDLISNILSSMTPEQSRIMVVSKEFTDKTELVEEWYGVKYNLRPVESNKIKEWSSCGLNSQLQIPPKNEFIPSVFDLKARDEHRGIVPRVLTETPMSRVWYLQDNEFSMPKAVVRCEIFSPLPMMEPVNANLNHLFVAVVKDLLTEYSYAAGVAGLHYMIVDSVYGIEIVVNGYDHKLGLLLNRVMEKVVDCSVEPQRFEVLKELYLRTLKNWDEEQPYSHATYYMTYLLREKRWSNQELLAAMDDVSLEKFNSFLKEFTKKIKFEWLLYGNITAEEASNLVSSCEQPLLQKGTSALLPTQTCRLREINLPKGTNHLYQAEHKNHLSSCSTVLFQAGIQSTRANVLVELLEHIANEPCFDQLRTKEQLGYIVFTGVRKSHGTHGIQFIVQSDRHPVYVEQRIDNFLTNFQEILEKMTEEEFLQHRNAVFVRKSEKPKKMTDRAGLLWGEISLQQYNFDRQAIELAELDTVTLKEIRELFKETMGPDSSKRKRLSVHVVSMAEGGAGPKEGEEFKSKLNPEQVVIEDVAHWKRKQGLYPASSPNASNFPGSCKAKL